MKNIFNKKTSNLLSLILSLLNVKHTNNYTNKYFNEHPNKYNMFGLSKMLTHFGISNSGIKVLNKEEDVRRLIPPYIAHLGGDFAVVENTTKRNVSYYWGDGERINVPMEDFLDIWTGATLIVETDKNSKEPEYEKHKKEEFVSNSKKILLIITIFSLIIIGIIQSEIYTQIGLILLSVVNLVGIYIGYLLVLKQMNNQSKQADKICSLFSRNNCNDVLNSSSSKFLGIISWSEVGLSYFISNIFILFFAPQLLSYLTLISIGTLPYAFWSIWYQKTKAKAWCPLCLIIQLLFYIQFIINFTCGYIQMPDLTIINLLSIGLIYTAPFLIISLILPILVAGQKVTSLTQEYNGFKVNDKVFYSVLREQPRFEISRDTSNIILGNPDAESLITIFTNPHCSPCIEMHKNMNQILKEIKDKVCFQLIFSSFSQDLNESNKLLISACLNYKNSHEILDYWFHGGHLNPESFRNKYGIKTDSENVISEFNKHEHWKKTTGIQGTPTLLINGYQVPRNYKLNELKDIF